MPVVLIILSLAFLEVFSGVCAALRYYCSVRDKGVITAGYFVFSSSLGTVDGWDTQGVCFRPEEPSRCTRAPKASDVCGDAQHVL